MLVTLGTGIGGALMFGDQLWRGAGGMAGEFGHQQVVPQRAPVPVRPDRLLGAVLLRQRARPPCSCPARGLVGTGRVTEGDPGALTGAMVTEAASAGDAVALDAFRSVGDWLGVGLANLVASLDPALLVVGGGVSAAGRLLLDPARAALARSLVGADDRVVPPLVPAALGPQAGLVGAALLARGL